MYGLKIIIMFIITFLFNINIFAQIQTLPERLCKKNAENLILQNELYKNIWSIKSKENVYKVQNKI